MTIKQEFGRLLDPRIRAAAKSLYDEIRVLRNHRRGVRRVLKLQAERTLRIQFGCGPARKPGWLNTDMWAGPWARPDVCLDASRPLPFRSNSVAEIYSEHMFEHLEYPSGVTTFLRECFRVLASGATMTIGVPDLSDALQKYAQRTPPVSEGAADRRYILRHPLEELNYIFHQDGEHKFLYDEEFLTVLLQHFGFNPVSRRDFDPSHDTELRCEGTLYIVATKPAPAGAPIGSVA